MLIRRHGSKALASPHRNSRSNPRFIVAQYIVFFKLKRYLECVLGPPPFHTISPNLTR